MKMNQYKDLTFADTVRLAAEAEQKNQEAAARVQLSSKNGQVELMNFQARLEAGEISQAEFDTLNPLTRGVDSTKPKQYTYNQESPIDEESIAAELTPEDRKMLILK